jgi:hypothetical protein
MLTIKIGALSLRSRAIYRALWLQKRVQRDKSRGYAQDEISVLVVRER